MRSPLGTLFFKKYSCSSWIPFPRKLTSVSLVGLQVIGGIFWTIHPSFAQTESPPDELVFPSSPPQTFDEANSIPPLSDEPPVFDNYPGNPFNQYRVKLGDGVTVFVPQFPEFNAQGQIDPEGQLLMPFLGRVSLVGLTLEEAEAKIQYELSQRYLRDAPDVTVNATPASLTVTIAGEVVRPGLYALNPGRSDVKDALLVAGGSTVGADLRGVIVRRALIDGTIVERQVDLFTPLQNGTGYPALFLQDGDAVIIPQIEVGTDEDYDRTLIARSNMAQQQIRLRVLSYATGRIATVALPNGSTFLDALTTLSPNPDQANLNDIALIRFDPEQGKAVTQSINGKRLLMGDVSQNVPLQDNDVVVVGRSLIAKITYALGVFTQPFRDVLGFLLFFDSLADSADNLFSPTDNN